MACFGLRSASPITRRAPTESRNCSGLALWNTSSGAWKNKGPGHRKKKVLSSWDARAPQMAGSSLAVGLESASSPKPSTRSGQRARSGVGPYVGIFTRREEGREEREGGGEEEGWGKLPGDAAPAFTRTPREQGRMRQLATAARASRGRARRAATLLWATSGDQRDTGPHENLARAGHQGLFRGIRRSHVERVRAFDVNGTGHLPHP